GEPAGERRRRVHRTAPDPSGGAARLAEPEASLGLPDVVRPARARPFLAARTPRIRSGASTARIESAFAQPLRVRLLVRDPGAFRDRARRDARGEEKFETRARTGARRTDPLRSLVRRPC